MKILRVVIWGVAIVAGGVVLLLERFGLFPEWFIGGPVLPGIAGVALLLDQALFAPARKWGYFISLMMIALSAGTVAQDALLVIDNWAIWPFVAGAVVLGVPLEMFAAHQRHHVGPSAGVPVR